MARTGRRPGGADTRGEILTAAREQFAAHGYRGATIRGIASRASVDPALVHHYFGTKRELFVATVEFPFDPPKMIGAVVSGDREGAGLRMAREVLAVWSTEQGEAALRSLMRSAMSDDELMRMMREFLITTLLVPITAEVSPDRHELRASLVASQVSGLALIRHVAAVEPLASVDVDTVAVAVAPTLQRYLTGDLPRSAF